MSAAFTPEFVEREYNNRALVPEHPAYFERWQRDSKFVRASLACELDIAYGPDSRHRIDFFRAEKARGTNELPKFTRSWIVAHVPEDVPAIERHLAAAGAPPRVQLSADPSLERGSAIFETAHGNLDASITTQLREIERGLADMARRH